MSYTHNLEISGMTFQVTNIHPYVHRFCKSYHIDFEGEHIINVTQEDIVQERLIAEATDSDHNGDISNAPDYYLESIALLRKLSDYICDYDRLLMHGSAIAVNGKGYIFTALSGTGKSTHTGLLRKLHGEKAVMINDDKPFLHYKDGQVFISGTPWMGKHFLGNNITVPLAGIFFLYRSEVNILEKTTAEDALVKMLSQCHRPTDAGKLMNTFDLIERILSSVPLYNLGCNMDISAAELSSSVMK